MKTITFIRHAKSSWKDPTLEDISRPLNRRGRANAPEMGMRLFYRDIGFDQIYTSPAQRACETVEMLTAPMGYPAEDVEVVPAFYTSNYEDILFWLRGLDSQADKLALVAHNPAITDIVNFMTLSNYKKIPTCGVVCLKVNVVNWADVGAGTAEVSLYMSPKQEHDELAVRA